MVNITYILIFCLQGQISILVVTESVKDDRVDYRIHAFQNKLYTDACFLKVIGKKM